MPTPLAHGVAGLAALRTAHGRRVNIRLILAALVIAQLPDFDFLPGLFTHDAGMFHRGPTHSLLGAALIALFVAAIFQRLSPWLFGRRGEPRREPLPFWMCYALVLPVYLSHLALDMVSLDTTGNPGMRLFWPFTNAYVATPLPVPEFLRNLVDLEFGPTGERFFATLFSLRAAAVYVIEAVLFSPVLLIPLVLEQVRERARRARRSATHPILDLEQGAEA